MAGFCLRTILIMSNKERNKPLGLLLISLFSKEPEDELNEKAIAAIQQQLDLTDEEVAQARSVPPTVDIVVNNSNPTDQVVQLKPVSLTQQLITTKE